MHTLSGIPIYCILLFENLFIYALQVSSVETPGLTKCLMTAEKLEKKKRSRGSLDSAAIYQALFVEVRAVSVN